MPPIYLKESLLQYQLPKGEGGGEGKKVSASHQEGGGGAWPNCQLTFMYYNFKYKDKKSAEKKCMKVKREKLGVDHFCSFLLFASKLLIKGGLKDFHLFEVG